ncbi:tautomerase family protein [Enterobacterales bacterium AE_CKDN230030158-1A_HGKHYDSX7]
MPHVIVKMLEGRTQEQKEVLTDEIAKALKTAIGCPDEVISVAIEDYAPADWKGQVYDTDILGAGPNLFKKPGYEP